MFNENVYKDLFERVFLAFEESLICVVQEVVWLKHPSVLIDFVQTVDDSID